MFHTLLFQPIYNGFIYLIGVMPMGDVGLAIIVLTIIIRALFYPAFTSSIRTQMGMQAIQGDLDEINTIYKNVPEERAKRTMGLFKKHNVRPFSGFLALLVQIPVFIALYLAFFKEGLPIINSNALYSFVNVPTVINLDFFGFMNLLSPYNIILTLFVGFFQYIVVKFSLSRMKTTSKSTVTPEKEAAQRMQKNMMLYFLPTLMAAVSYTLPSAVGLYFAVGSLISIGQEMIISKQMVV